jgi:hypothetical protein
MAAFQELSPPTFCNALPAAPPALELKDLHDCHERKLLQWKAWLAYLFFFSLFHCFRIIQMRHNYGTRQHFLEKDTELMISGNPNGNISSFFIKCGQIEI